MESVGAQLIECVALNILGRRTFPLQALQTNQHFTAYLARKQCRVRTKEKPTSRDTARRQETLQDTARHCKTPTHIRFARALTNQPKISTALPSTKEGRNKDVINAEVLMTNFIIQHNIPFAASDHLTKVCM